MIARQLPPLDATEPPDDEDVNPLPLEPCFVFVSEDGGVSDELDAV